jgi:hypothetical protein
MLRVYACNERAVRVYDRLGSGSSAAAGMDLVLGQT